MVCCLNLTFHLAAIECRLRAWTNGKCLATKNHQTLFVNQTFYRLDTLFGGVWLCLIKFEGHQTFDQKLKTFILFSCLMGDVLFVWTAAYQTCLKRSCVPSLVSGLYQLFHLCLIKRLNRLATHFDISIFGHQTMFDGVWSPNISRLCRP